MIAIRTISNNNNISREFFLGLTAVFCCDFILFVITSSTCQKKLKYSSVILMWRFRTNSNTLDFLDLDNQGTLEFIKA
jgi:hypothetical protein